MLLVLRPPLAFRIVAMLAWSFLAGALTVGGLTEGGWLLPLCLVGAAPIAAAAWRGWSLRIEVRSDDVVLVNWIRTVSIPWKDIERSGYDRGVWIRSRHGRTYWSAAFADSSRAFEFARVPGRAAAEQLESLRKKRRRDGGGRDR